MGTNYYIKEKERKRGEEESFSSDAYDDLIHIGKASFGWEFSFQKQEGSKHLDGVILDSKSIWMFFLSNLKENYHIINEYEEEVPFIEFEEMVNCYKSPGLIFNEKKLINHYDYCIEKDNKCDHAYKDSDGFTIMLTDYS